MARLFAILIVTLTLSAGVLAQPVSAQEDGVAGDWIVALFEGEFPLQQSVGRCPLWIEEDDGQLSAALTGCGLGFGQLHGSTDASGDFTLEGSLTRVLPALAVDEVTLTISGHLLDGVELRGDWKADHTSPTIRHSQGIIGTSIRTEPRWGDSDCDGAVTSRDALLVLVGTEKPCRVQSSQVMNFDEPNPYSADGNLDGFVDSRDALLILQVEAGLLERLPVL